MIHRREDITHVEVCELLGRDDPVILEIGAHHGEDTMRFLETFPRGMVYAFEPDPRCRAVLDANLKGHDRCVRTPVAIGAFDGFAPFYQSHGIPPGTRWQDVTDWDHSGSLRKPTGHLQRHPWCTFTEGPEVVVMRLDSWLRTCGPRGGIDLIWADVQGAEGDLIAGGAGALSRTRFFYTEFADSPQYDGQPTLAEIRAMLPAWELLGIYGENALLEHTGMIVKG